MEKGRAGGKARVEGTGWRGAIGLAWRTGSRWEGLDEGEKRRGGEKVGEGKTVGKVGRESLGGKAACVRACGCVHARVRACARECAAYRP